jgi:hypothetical protein
MQAQLFTNNRAGFPHPETGQPLTMKQITIPLKMLFSVHLHIIFWQNCCYLVTFICKAVEIKEEKK